MEEVNPDPAALAAAALEYADRGWPVFPLSPRGKQPLFGSPHRPGDPLRNTCHGECGRVGHGLHDATVNKNIITAWWARVPLANIGIATGPPGPDVLDVDVKHGMPGLVALEHLRRTPLLRGCGREVRTPSGGYHLYALATDGQGNGRLPKYGLDFRSSGGYVVAPPSVVDGRLYELLIDGPGTGPMDWKEIKNYLLPPRPLFRSPRQDLDCTALVTWLSQQLEGNRNGALFWAACRAAEAAAGQEVFDQLAIAAIERGLRPGEVDATINSARRRGGA